MSTFIDKKSYRSGFTLIEILIAISLTSIILTAVYSSFFLIHKAIGSVDEMMLKMQETRTVLDTLRREISSAIYDPENTRTCFRIVDRDFKGKPINEITFTAFSRLNPGITEFTYYVEEKDSRLVLFKKVNLESSREDKQATDILEDINGFSIEAKYDDKWVRTWDSDIHKSIPKELRVNLSMIVRGETITFSEILRPYIGSVL